MLEPTRVTKPSVKPSSDPINGSALEAAFQSFHNAAPFNHCVVENFITQDWLPDLEQEFLCYDSPQWFVYKNAIEDKKALNNWNVFPPATYKFFQYLNSKAFLDRLSKLVGIELFADYGLNGGGWHIHGPGGNLNPHVDYSIHPKLWLQRKINIIIYMSRELKEEHGGHLGLWEQDPVTLQPGKLAKEIAPKFNRAIIFDTTLDSWHGISRSLVQPAGIYRKSLAIYYLCTPPAGTDQRGRALFAPRDDQKCNPSIEELIRLRSDVKSSAEVYQGLKRNNN